MDRNGDWEKIKKPYELFTEGKGNSFASASEYIKSQYGKDLGDDAVEVAPSPAKREESKTMTALSFSTFAKTAFAS